MWLPVDSTERDEAPPDTSLTGATVHVRVLWNKVQVEGDTAHTHTHPHERAHVQVYLLRLGLHPASWSTGEQLFLRPVVHLS